MKSYIPLIIILVFAAGCTGLSGVFGGDILNIKQNIIQEGQKDIVVIKDEITIPKSPMLPDQSFVFSFLLENVDKTSNARNVVVELFNAPTVKNDDDQKGKSCNTGTGSTCKPDKCQRESGAELTARSFRPVEFVSRAMEALFGREGNYESLLPRHDKGCLMLPGEQRPINFYLKTPTEQEIVGIKTEPVLDYRVLYDFESNSLFVMPVIDMEEIIKSQRSNDKINLDIIKSHGSGPVKTDMELYGTKYMLSGQSATLIFKISNIGRGNVLNSQIEKKSFILKMPADIIGNAGKLVMPDGETFEPATEREKTGIRFKCGWKDAEIYCSNIEPIEMYKDQTRGSLRFEITKVANINQPFKSFEIKASVVKYTYELRGSQEITIKPFES
ncbi:MAG: hypothetical protein QMD85_04390 [Candidatus Aenigmarchaeota archaeon]|nr:hypothetical protein [Candidatus Aenigmarchaeota archaeon]MDI6722811.1 hypothetical protein [Candidatus Aenigmarchaeota archaeon]